MRGCSQKHYSWLKNKIPETVRFLSQLAANERVGTGSIWMLHSNPDAQSSGVNINRSGNTCGITMKLRPTRVRLSPRADWQPTQPPSERSTDLFYAVSAPTYLLVILLLPSLPEPLTKILQIKKMKCFHLFTLCVCTCTQAQVHMHIIAHMCGSRTTVCKIRPLHVDSRGSSLGHQAWQ